MLSSPMKSKQQALYTCNAGKALTKRALIY
nr:MAG TPA: hypothetical protein [Caudoviricetes sp.]